MSGSIQREHPGASLRNQPKKPPGCGISLLGFGIPWILGCGRSPGCGINHQLLGLRFGIFGRSELFFTEQPKWAVLRSDFWDESCISLFLRSDFWDESHISLFLHSDFQHESHIFPIPRCTTPMKHLGFLGGSGPFFVAQSAWAGIPEMNPAFPCSSPRIFGTNPVFSAIPRCSRCTT